MNAHGAPHIANTKTPASVPLSRGLFVCSEIFPSNFLEGLRKSNVRESMLEAVQSHTILCLGTVCVKSTIL